VQLRAACFAARREPKREAADVAGAVFAAAAAAVGEQFPGAAEDLFERSPDDAFADAEVLRDRASFTPAGVQREHGTLAVG